MKHLRSFIFLMLIAMIIFVHTDLAAAAPSVSSSQSSAGIGGGIVKQDPPSTSNPVPFDPNNPNKYSNSTPSTDTQEPEDDPSSPWYVPGWVDNLIKKIDDMIQTFKDLMSGKLIHDAIQGVIVYWADELMAPLYGAFEKSYLFTPHIAEIALVYKGWSIFSVVGLVALLIAIAYLAIKVVRGKQELRKLLFAFLGCFFGLLLSLTILNFTNVGINWMGQKVIEGVLGTTDISYKDLNGQEILKALVIGSDSITDPTYQSKTLGQITVETEGGVFTLLGMLCIIVIPLFLLSVIKSLLLMIMAIFVSLWVSHTAFTGKVESLAGYFNLYVRTLIVGLLTATHWAIFVRMQTDYGSGVGFAADIGISPIIFSGLSVIGLLIFFFFFWIKPLFRAVVHPITLGGGQVIESIGKRGVKTSETLNAMGKRFGAESLQRKSLDFKTASQGMIQAGQRMQNVRGAGVTRAASTLSGGVSEVLQGVKYQEPEDHEWLIQNGSIVVEDDHVIEAAESKFLVEPALIQKIAQEKGFKDSTLLQVNESDKGMMKNIYTKLKADHGNDVSWNQHSREILITGNHQGLLNDMQKSGVKYKTQTGLGKDGVFVDSTNQKIHQISNTDKSKSIKNELQSALPSSTKLKIPNSDSAAAYQSIIKGGYSWADKIKHDHDGIWVPNDLLPDVKPVIESLLSSKSERVKIDLPKNSRFLGEMIEHWKKDSSHETLINSLDPHTDKAFVMVHKDHVSDFRKAYDAYRKDRKPYWRTKEGKIKVIIDNVPVDYGKPPSSGLNMGSYEELQKDMINRHHSNRKQ